MKRPGLREVAIRAGVSMGTVSNALNRPEMVRPENREKVEQAVRELGYIGSHLSIQLRSGKSSLIGVLVPDVGNPFWGTMLRGIEQEMDDTRDFIIVSSTRQNPDRERAALESLLSREVDGLIIGPSGDESDLLRRFVDRGIRVVTLERRVSNPMISSVMGDSIEGGRLAAEVLLHAGFRRIALIGGPETISWSAARKSGAELALLRSGLNPTEALIAITIPDLTSEEGEGAVDELLEHLPEGGGVICGNDLVALGVYRGLHARGYAIPDDFSVVGYDDDDFASALSPALTTLQQRPGEMGSAAARLLLNSVDGRTGHLAFPPELISRSSVRSPSRS